MTEPYLIDVFSALARADVADGLALDANTIRVRQIREDTVYGGLRVTCQMKLGSARVPLQVDIGIGDAHASVEVEVPSLLSQPTPRLLAYAKETVIAEKLEAAVKLGVQNSRMKDFYDLATLGAEYAFEGEAVRVALAHTFLRRKTGWPTVPLRVLLQELAEEPSTPAQWAAFQRKAAPRNRWSLEETFALVAAFAEQPLTAAATGETFNNSWFSGGPWSEKGEGE